MCNDVIAGRPISDKGYTKPLERSTDQLLSLMGSVNYAADASRDFLQQVVDTLRGREVSWADIGERWASRASRPGRGFLNGLWLRRRVPRPSVQRPCLRRRASKNLTRLARVRQAHSQVGERMPLKAKLAARVAFPARAQPHARPREVDRVRQRQPDLRRPARRRSTAGATARPSPSRAARVTYGELDAMANRYAHWAQGAEPAPRRDGGALHAQPAGIPRRSGTACRRSASSPR